MKPFESWKDFRAWLEETNTSPAGRPFDRVWVGVIHRVIGRMDLFWYGGDGNGGDSYTSHPRRKAAA